MCKYNLKRCCFQTLQMESHMKRLHCVVDSRAMPHDIRSVMNWYRLSGACLQNWATVESIFSLPWSGILWLVACLYLGVWLAFSTSRTCKLEVGADRSAIESLSLWDPLGTVLDQGISSAVWGGTGCTLIRERRGSSEP